MARTTRRRTVASSGGEDQTNTNTDERGESSQQAEDNSDPQNYPQDTGFSEDSQSFSTEMANTESAEVNGHETSASIRQSLSSTSASSISAAAPVSVNNSSSDGRIASGNDDINQADTTATGDRQIMRHALTDLTSTPCDEPTNSVSLQKRAQLLLDKLQSKRQKDGQMIEDYKSMLQERVSSQVDRLQNAMYEMHKKRNSGVQPLLQDLQATLHRCKGLELELTDFKQRLATFNGMVNSL